MDDVYPQRTWPKTPREMAHQAPLVVVADAVDQQPYWKPFPGGPNPWQSFTATNFRVVQVLKGPSLAWVQTFGEGVPTHLPLSFPCPALAQAVVNEPPPTPGSRYILFQWDTGSLRTLGGGPGFIGKSNWPSYMLPFHNAWFRFVVRDGVVHSEAENGETLAMNITPQPLKSFVTSLSLPG